MELIERPSHYICRFLSHITFARSPILISLYKWQNYRIYQVGTVKISIFSNDNVCFFKFILLLFGLQPNTTVQVIKQ